MGRKVGRGEGGKIGRDSGVRKSATGGGGGAPMKHRQTETERDRDRKRQRQTHREGERHRERQRQRGGSGKQTDGVTRMTPQDSGSTMSQNKNYINTVCDTCFFWSNLFSTAKWLVRVTAFPSLQKY